VKDFLIDVIALQDIEVQIFRAEAGLKELPKELEEIDSIIQARKRSLDAVDEEIAELNKRREPLEADLKENQTILNAADARIKRIKTNKEFLALQREGDIAKKRKVDIEEQLLSLMERIEIRTKDREKILKTFEVDRTVLDEKKDNLLSNQQELERVIAVLKDKIGELREKVDHVLLSKYDRIKEKRKGLVVVQCVDGVCRGCHMHIPPQLYNELVRADKLITCPVCQRILYIETDKGARAENT
jgi:predicted  nucleic acid-binding Zn-ribbon protein